MNKKRAVVVSTFPACTKIISKGISQRGVYLDGSFCLIATPSYRSYCISKALICQTRRTPAQRQDISNSRLGNLGRKLLVNLVTILPNELASFACMIEMVERFQCKYQQPLKSPHSKNFRTSL